MHKPQAKMPGFKVGVTDMRTLLLATTLLAGHALAAAPDASSFVSTATGTSVARALANRAADVVNVLDWGADPTGATTGKPLMTTLQIGQRDGALYAPIRVQSLTLRAGPSSAAWLQNGNY